ncbi:MAG: ABC transporter substrate-binding protein [Oscillospiraceae bacterium]|nr:ABC transporter substrate-binding protein [Oscillospiraceae bacterium]
MKNIARIIAGAAALLMTAASAGCTFMGKETDSKSERRGGYVEEPVDTGGDSMLITEFMQKPDGVEYYDVSKRTLFTLAKGDQDFKGEIASIIKDKIPTDHSVCAAVSPVGDYFFSRVDTNSGGFSNIYVSSDGSQNKIETDEMILSAEFTTDNRLFIITYGRVFEVSTANYSLKTVCDTGYEVRAFDIIGDNLIIVDENGVKIYDYKNDKEAETPETLNNFFKNYTDINYTGSQLFDICCDDKENMYILSSDGVFRYVMNGNEIEKILDGSKYQIGNEDNGVNSLTYIDDGSFYVSFKNGSLIKYRYDPELVNEKTSLLKIYSLEDNDTLKQAVRDFSMNNNNTEIDYMVGMRSGMTYEDAMKNLTTQILSGSAPDVILLDGINIDNYIDKNLLLDLSGSENQWNKDGKLLDNISKWNNRDGKIYSVACKFRVPAVAANGEDLDKIQDYSDIADLVEKIRKDFNQDYPILSVREADSIIKNALIYEGKDLITGGDIDKEKLKEFYGNCTKVYENYRSDECQYWGGMYTSGSKTISPDEYSFGYNVLQAIGDTGVMALGTLNSFEYDINYATSIDDYRKNPGVKMRYGLNTDSKVFIPECNLGIIENAKNVDEAVKFIAQALGSETQKTDHYDGLPVNTDTLDFYYRKNEDSQNNDSINIYHFATQKDDMMNVQWMSADEVKEFDSYIRSLNDPLYFDKVTRDIIVNEGLMCAEGSITAGQAADDAFSQLELKMKE